MVEKGEPFIAERKMVVNEKEAGKFLKLIKHSEFSVVEQLKTTYSDFDPVFVIEFKATLERHLESVKPSIHSN